MADQSSVYSTRQIITKREIDKIKVPTAYEVVARLRPEFLSSPAARQKDGSVVPPVVYINGLIAGDVTLLRGMPVSAIAEV